MKFAFLFVLAALFSIALAAEPAWSKINAKQLKSFSTLFGTLFPQFRSLANNAHHNHFSVKVALFDEVNIENS